MPRKFFLFGLLATMVLATGTAVLLWQLFGNVPLVGRSGSSRGVFLPIVVSEAGQRTPDAYPAANAAGAPTAVSPAPLLSGEVRHVVQTGDTLSAIARQYETTVDAIMAVNGLTNPDALTVGQSLLISEPTPIAATLVPTVAATPPTAVPPTATVNPPTATPPLPVVPLAVNGLAPSDFIIMPENVKANARAIYLRGQELGRNGRAYSKIGDSTIANPFFMARFDSGPYNLADYAYLQPVIDYFAGSHGRDSVAQRIGLHAWTVLDPTWADKSVCAPNETPIACEFRIHNPAVVLIRLGSNDVGAPGLFDESMRQIVQFSIDNGVIPVLGTKADRHEGSNQNNDMLRRIAADYQIPLWEFDVVAGTMPGRGLDADAVHMLGFYAHDYANPEAFTRGHSVHNLTALMLLDALWRDVITDQ